MKMVVAYVEPERFEEIREELLSLGFLSISVMSANGSTPESVVSGTYRGAKLERHLRPKTRIEAVVADDASSTVVDAIVRTGGERTFVTVMAVEEAHPEELVKSVAVAEHVG
jgi:nitrogen regulatory protein PII